MLPPLSSDERRQLLLLARTFLTEVIQHNRIPELPPLSGRSAEPAGAFVTLHCRGRLRGCVGLPSANLSLGETVAQAAIGAARNDPRFPPICAEEVVEVEIEISVLSEARLISPGAVEIGRHGLIVVRGSSRGLLLPQVATERGWTALRFLNETCLKAGLPADVWLDSETQVLAFEAEVFSEGEIRPAETGAAEGRARQPKQ
jgi:AmmeMemoRadiSam system protein A